MARFAPQRHQSRPVSQRSPKNVYEWWLSIELMAVGIKRAGANPSSANIITSLRSHTDWIGGGLFESTIKNAAIVSSAVDRPRTSGLEERKIAFVPTP